jgi:hypothetical protein
MASTFSDLKFELIGSGEQSNTWGNTTNTNIGTAIEQAITGLSNPVFTSDATLTLSLTDLLGPALQVPRALVLNVTSVGALTATREMVVPTIEKQYLVQNNTSGGQSILVKTAAGTGITVPNGVKMHLYVNGVNVIDAVSHFSALTLGAPLPVASGGSGSTTSTGTGSNVLSISPTFVAPNLGTPASGTLTNATSLPIVEGTTGTLSVARGGTGVTTSTGSGSTVLSISPDLTGTPTAPTAALNTNTTQLATTAYVINQIGASTAGVSSISAGTTGLTPSTATSGAVTLAGTLNVANGGTGLTTATPYSVVFAGTTSTGAFQAAAGPGTATHVLTSNGPGALPTFQAAPAGGNLTGAVTSVGLATSLGSFTSANLAGALTDETGSGAAVFANTPTLVTPVLGTPNSGNLNNCTADGTNKVGYRNIPPSGAKTSSYTLVAADVGKFVELGTGGSVVVPAGVFAAGDVVSIFNNTGASISCTCSAVTDVYKAGTDADISSFSVTTRGVANILFITATRAVVTGNLA